MFSKSDSDQITAHRISPQSAQRQWEFVCEGKTNIKIVRPALKNDGLFSFDEAEINNLIANYKDIISEKKIVKFVPASGAATRMFKDLFEAWNDLKSDSSYQLTNSGKIFFDNLSRFAFYDTLQECMKKQGLNLTECLNKGNYDIILEYFLTVKGLNYANLPKGLLLFHQYDAKKRTALEEHLVEAAQYAYNEDKIAYLHFTVSQEHEEIFKNHCKEVIPEYEKQFEIKYHIEFSTQHPSTDTIAFTIDNKPFLNTEGNLLFRPGGHGSLIENLNRIDADIVLIKNIDNVTLDRYKQDTVTYKKVLVCFLLQLQQQVFKYLKLFDNQNDDKDLVLGVEIFLEDNFFIHLPQSYQKLSLAEKQDFLYNLLNRPIRVCGMVKRENEPGGGPFWVKTSNNDLSLQIVETSEMDLSNAKQKEILDKSEFFNPVDLACSLKDHKGEKFDLNNFIDHSRYFVSEKSYEGKVLKAIENPGLWNGAMSNWLTVFVAVPLSTFTPVKTVNDLLRKEHTN
jgi:hypothetical protein